MNRKLRNIGAISFPGKSRGIAILDVLLAIAIFVIGMLALASLQGNLTRSSADANVRTVGTNIAEELIESLRSIESIGTPGTGYVCQTSIEDIAMENVYQCIDTSNATISRAGTAYTVSAVVRDYYVMPDKLSLTANVGDLPEEWDTTISDFKYVDLTVSWVDENDDSVGPAGFQNTGAADKHLGSGSVTLSSVIPSIPNIGSAFIVSDDDGSGTPPVAYTPGARPDIVAIGLSDGKFKESTTPKPDVVRTGELAETWFDVITYSQNNSGAVFLRREEFLVISCECELVGESQENKALMPTIWTGQSYSEEEWVAKPYGVSANNQQSAYCDTCCRDHHDVDTTDKDRIYDPARLDNRPNWSVDGSGNSPADDHAHYNKKNNGAMSIAAVGDDYVEACRMVRKDGFMRVAQDFRQEGFVSFPEGYLDTPGGVNNYSGYVTDEVAEFIAINGNPDRIDPPAAGKFPGDSSNATTLPFLGIDSQQMRARGIYIDHVGSLAQDLIDCIKPKEAAYAAIINPGPDDETPGDQCNAPGVVSHLEVTPFFEVQTTWLAWWDTDPMGDPVSVTNEAVKDDNEHSRGYALLEDSASTATTINVLETMHRGNTGLTVTDSITPISDDPDAIDEWESGHALYVDVNGGGAMETPNGYIWTADYDSAVNRVDAADTVITPNGNEYCTRTSTVLRCITPLTQTGSITISGYTKLQGQNFVPLYICVDEPGDQNLFTVSNVIADGSYNEATISWPILVNVNYQDPSISIEESPDGCLTP